jgi:uncharacterized membrane protein
MVRLSTKELERIQTALRQVEEKSRLEVIVRVAKQSGSYRDITYLVSFVFGFAMLSYILYADAFFETEWVLPFVIATMGIGFAVGLLQRTLRLLTGEKRKLRQVEETANATYYAEAASTTTDRTGVLIYASVTENVVVLKVDHPLQGRVDGASWGSIERIGHLRDRTISHRIVRMLEALANLGADHFPSDGVGDNELPDGVRLG